MESDPGPFSELLKTLGVPLIVDDLYSLEPSSLATLQPLHALVFLFKYVGGTDERGGGQGTYDDDFPGFFARQAVNNACATIAVLNGICNIPSLQMGPELTELLSFTTGMDPQTTGEAITSSSFLRSAHNNLSPPPAVSLDGLNLPKVAEDAYHFVVYLPVTGTLYELDGLKRSPVKHGSWDDTLSGEGWLTKAREVIENRIATYPAGSVHFNLLALRTDPLPVLKTQLAEAEAASNHALASELVDKISLENDKRARWAFENSLRRHNHVGLAHSLLLALAKLGRLDSSIEVGKVKMKERLAKAKETGMDDD
jgi:ubiquitin carboxyl-terminal hydrolase L5